MDVLEEDGEGCVLRQLLRKHVVASAGGHAARSPTATDETDRLAEWVLWQGSQWKAVEQEQSAAVHSEKHTPGPAPHPEPESEPAEPEPEPGSARHEPGRGREEVLCEICAKKVMLSELSKHNAGKKHRRAVRLAAQAADETTVGADDASAMPEIDPEPEPHVPLLADANLQEISCHRAVFGPMGLSGLSAEDARQFVLPYDYPKARAYAITFREYVRRDRDSQTEEKRLGDAPSEKINRANEVAAATVTMELLPFSFLLDDPSADEDQSEKHPQPEMANANGEQKAEVGDGAPLDAMTRRLQQRSMPAQHMGAGGRRILSTLLQWAATTDAVSGRSTHGEHALYDRQHSNIMIHSHCSFSFCPFAHRLFRLGLTHCCYCS